MQVAMHLCFILAVAPLSHCLMAFSVLTDQGMFCVHSYLHICSKVEICWGTKLTNA